MNPSRHILFFITDLKLSEESYSKDKIIETLKNIKKEVIRVEKERDIFKQTLVEQVEQGKSIKISELLIKVKEELEKELMEND